MWIYQPAQLGTGTQIASAHFCTYKYMLKKCYLSSYLDKILGDTILGMQLLHKILHMCLLSK